MSNSTTVSVIIPVYNSEDFVRRAVSSVRSQSHVAEIILIDDGSTDHSLLICKECAADDKRIMVLRHPDGENYGSGPTRNLGLEAATSDFVAFLDVDDVYLPGRFEKAFDVLNQYQDADGCYAPVTTEFETEELRQQYARVNHAIKIGLSKEVAPGSLFGSLARGQFGYLHLNGLMIERVALGSIRFDSSLRQTQDTDFILRIANRLRLYPMDINRPVAIRNIHGDNTIFNESDARKYRRIYLLKCMNNKFYDSNDRIANLYIVSRYIGTTNIYRPFKHPRLIGLPVKLLFVAIYLVTHPRVLISVV